MPAACIHGNRTLGLPSITITGCSIRGCELRGAAGLWNYGIGETEGLKSSWFALV